MRATRFRATGRVQGVSFRAFTLRNAEQLDLDGWVRNEADGSVTGEVRGPAEAVERFLAALRHGPRGARVEQLEVDEIAPPAEAPDAPGFAIR